MRAMALPLTLAILGLCLHQTVAMPWFCRLLPTTETEIFGCVPRVLGMDGPSHSDVPPIDISAPLDASSRKPLHPCDVMPCKYAQAKGDVDVPRVGSSWEFEVVVDGAKSTGKVDRTAEMLVRCLRARDITPL